LTSTTAFCQEAQNSQKQDVALEFHTQKKPTKLHRMPLKDVASAQFDALSQTLEIIIYNPSNEKIYLAKNGEPVYEEYIVDAYTNIAIEGCEHDVFTLRIINDSWEAIGYFTLP
jgi:hypothetical protein